MNTRSAFLVRLLCLLFLGSFAVQVCAQAKGELTKDFDKLSPKERSKIAAQETQEAAADSTYQALMHQADQAFQAAHYEDALALYEQARVARPYNVYPKVKIQDLQALIRKRDLEKAAKEPTPLPESEAASVPDPAPSTDTAPVRSTFQEALPKTPQASEPAPVLSTSQEVLPAPPQASEPVLTPVPRPEPPPAATKAPARVITPPQAKHSTIGERVYVEAGAVVTERTVDDDGKTVIYRKVVHSWGQTFYFKEGLTISQFQWDQRFSE